MEATLELEDQDVEQEVYTFDELSDRAKDKAREWMRDCEMQDFDTEFQFEDFERVAEILGVDFNVKRIQLHNGTYKNEPDIRYSGFCSPGDGLSFEGSYHHAPDSPAKIRAEYPEETTLHAIADRLDALQNGYRLISGNRMYAVIKQKGRDYHAGTMDVDLLSDSVTGEEFDYDGDHWQIVREEMRAFARWMYKSLEAEYDYRLSDEAIDDTLRANDYEFDEDGERV